MTHSLCCKYEDLQNNVGRWFKETGVDWYWIFKLKVTIIDFVKYIKFNEEENSISHFTEKCGRWKFLSKKNYSQNDLFLAIILKCLSYYGVCI